MSSACAPPPTNAAPRILVVVPGHGEPHRSHVTMSNLARTPDFEPLKQTFKRLANITRDHDSTAYDATALGEPAEKALHAALEGVRSAASAAAAAGDFSGALDQLSSLKAPVDTLFEAVMVMAEDPTVRANRLGLLSSVGAAFRDIADFKHLN